MLNNGQNLETIIKIKLYFKEVTEQQHAEVFFYF